MMILGNTTLVAVMMMMILNQQLTIRGQDQDLNLQGPVHPVVQGPVPVRQVQGQDQGQDQGQGHQTERGENNLILGQGNW